MVDLFKNFDFTEEDLISLVTYLDYYSPSIEKDWKSSNGNVVFMLHAYADDWYRLYIEVQEPDYVVVSHEDLGTGKVFDTNFFRFEEGNWSEV